jgi:hypothetical protein
VLCQQPALGCRLRKRPAFAQGSTESAEAQAARENARRIMGRSSAAATVPAGEQGHLRAASGGAGIEDEEFEAQLGESSLPQWQTASCLRFAS